MKHPIYRDTATLRIYNLWKDDYEYFKEQAIGFVRDGSETVETINAMNDDFVMMQAVEAAGLVVIEASRDEWESDISKRTISKMKIGDIKLPFNAGAIVDTSLDDDYLLFARAMVEGSGAGFLRLLVPVDELPAEEANKAQNRKGDIILTLPYSMTVEEAVSKIGPSQSRYVYMTLSILMYISAFKDDNSRVVNKRLKACSASRKKGIPKHRVNKIVLKQKISEEGVSRDGSSRGSLSVSHIVRGHWRNQWYASLELHKPKWIDPYWKGSGKDELEKIYKV